MTKHCYVRNAKPFPSYMSTEKKASLSAELAVYQAGKAGTGMTAIETEVAGWMAKYKDEDDSFLDMLHREYGDGV
eukprot:6854920-Prymnesium_polylepis.1